MHTFVWCVPTFVVCFLPSSSCKYIRVLPNHWMVASFHLLWADILVHCAHSAKTPNFNWVFQANETCPCESVLTHPKAQPTHRIDASYVHPTNLLAHSTYSYRRLNLSLCCCNEWTSPSVIVYIEPLCMPSCHTVHLGE